MRKGPLDIDDDARLARCEQSVAIGGDEPPLLLADPVGHLEAHIGRIDDDAIGIAEREDVHVDLLRKIGDEARALAVAGNARVIGDGRLGSALAARPQGPSDASSTAQAKAHAGTAASQDTLELASSPTALSANGSGVAGAGKAASRQVAICVKIGSISAKS